MEGLVRAAAAATAWALEAAAARAAEADWEVKGGLVLFWGWLRDMGEGFGENVSGKTFFRIFLSKFFPNPQNQCTAAGPLNYAPTLPISHAATLARSISSDAVYSVNYNLEVYRL